MNRILVVDDDQFVRRSIADLLKAWDYEPMEASNPIEGFACANEEDLSGILLDIRLGEKNGLDLLKRMRAAEIETPVIVITAYPDEYNRNRFFDLGAVAFLGKPVNPMKLKEILGSISNH